MQLYSFLLFFSLFFSLSLFFFFFFFNDTATTEIYTLSLHDALPISTTIGRDVMPESVAEGQLLIGSDESDRKSTRLNSSHVRISYAVFCLKKKKKKKKKQKKNKINKTKMKTKNRRQQSTKRDNR